MASPFVCSPPHETSFGGYNTSSQDIVPNLFAPAKKP